ncbi:Arp2/3 complex-activating protein rickA [Entamoeba marina]
MKEKKDEEKMREHIDKNVLAIKNATKSYNKLIHTCENYCRKESLFLSTIEDLSETLSSFSKSQITDLDQGLGFVTSIIEVMYIGRSVTNSLFSDAIIPKLKQSLQQYQTAVSCFERKYDTDMRKYTYNLDAAEKKAASSKSKSPEYIQQTIEEFKLADGAKQKYTVYALQASTKMVRGLYCGIIKQFCDLFENEKNSFEQIANTFKSNGDEILNMANSVENYGEEVDKLIRPKQQTLIDLKALTPQLKKVLKDAGLRRKDLCDPETVKLLITTVENAVKAGKVDHSVLQMLKAKPGEKKCSC